MTEEAFERPIHKTCINYAKIQGLEKENSGLRDLMELHNTTTKVITTQIENLRSDLTTHNDRVNTYIINAVRKEDIDALHLKVEENGKKIQELDTIFKAAKSLLSGLQWLGYITGSAVAVHQAIQYFYGVK